MKIEKFIFFFFLLSLPIFSQVITWDTNSFYKSSSNQWKDSVTTRESSTTKPTVGLPTEQVRSTVNLDTVISNFYRIDDEDWRWRVFGNVYTDSVGVAPNVLNVAVEVGYSSGAGGFPDITGIEWDIIQTITANGSFDLILTDSVDIKLPQTLYFRFREIGAQQNNYNLTLNTKRNK